MQAFKQSLSLCFPDLARAYYNLRTARQVRRLSMLDTPYGFKFTGEESKQYTDFEPEETELIRQQLEGVEVFVDVGANIGHYTCLGRSLNKHVIAIEPLQQNLDVLYTNLTANGWDGVEVFPVGVSSQPGFTTLFGGGTGASLYQNWSGAIEVIQQTIAVSTLDCILAGRFAGKKLLIKIDVEGWEFKVLQGAEQVLAMSPAPAWLLEICLTEHHPDGINPHFLAVFDQFWGQGYSAFTADTQRRMVHREDVMRWVINQNRDFGHINFLFEK